MTKTALAKKIGKTASAISQLENGTIRPDPETVARLALALSFPVSFFAMQSNVTALSIEDCHFRSLRSASQYKRRQAIRFGELVLELLLFLENQGIVLPAQEINKLRISVSDNKDIEELAVHVRRQWGLGLGPIVEPIPLVEAQGVRVLPLVDIFDEVDAFSFWHGELPFIMLSMAKPSSRIHYDVFHELGHLIMHEDVAPANPEAESEANRFAGAFLLPSETFARECPTRWNYGVFRALKKRWHVSIQALVVRAYQLGKISHSSYRRAFTEINRRGIRKNEPGEWSLRRPYVLCEALRLVQEEFTVSEIADATCTHPAVIEKWISVVCSNELEI